MGGAITIKGAAWVLIRERVVGYREGNSVLRSEF